MQIALKELKVEIFRFSRSLYVATGITASIFLMGKTVQVALQQRGILTGQVFTVRYFSWLQVSRRLHVCSETACVQVVDRQTAQCKKNVQSMR